MGAMGGIVCVCVCVRLACVRACMRACMRVHVCGVCFNKLSDYEIKCLFNIAGLIYIVTNNLFVNQATKMSFHEKFV